MTTEKMASPVATTFMVRNSGNGVEVAIQRRNIVTPGYDPEGADTIEVGPGETMQAGETPRQTAIRAIHEEWGVGNPGEHVVKLHGNYDVPTSHRGVFLTYSPLPVMVNTEYGYPWVSIPVVIQVDEKLAFNEEKSDGEAKEGRFIPVAELAEWLASHPEDFFRLTHACAVVLCHLILSGELEIPVVNLHWNEIE